VASRGRPSSTQHIANLVGAFLDLSFVASACEQLLALPAARDPGGVLRTALWTSAVVHYARCFITGARPPLPRRVQRTMTADELTTHDRTLKERHKYVAHVELSRQEILDVGRFAARGKGSPYGHAVNVHLVTHDPEHVRGLGNLARELCLVLSPIIDDELAKMPAKPPDPDG
jgi:hypothetical protein